MGLKQVAEISAITEEGLKRIMENTTI